MANVSPLYLESVVAEMVVGLVGRSGDQLGVGGVEVGLQARNPIEWLLGATTSVDGLLEDVPELPLACCCLQPGKFHLRMATWKVKTGYELVNSSNENRLAWHVMTCWDMLTKYLTRSRGTWCLCSVPFLPVISARVAMQTRRILFL